MPEKADSTDKPPYIALDITNHLLATMNGAILLNYNWYMVT